MNKFKIATSQIIIILVCLVFILGSSILTEKKIAVPFVTLVLNLSLAFLASIFTGIYYEFAIRKEFKDEIIQLLKLNNEISKSGIVNYYSNFSDIKLASLLERSKEIEIYLTYGQTVLNGINSSIELFLTKKGNKFTIYISHEDNLFVDALGAHWGYKQTSYNSQGIKTKIGETKELLSDIIRRLITKKQLRATIQIFQLHRHPVFYSFYRFDNTMIFSPSKISESKTIKPMAFIVSKSNNENGIFERCMAELGDIKEDPSAYSLFYSNKK